MHAQTFDNDVKLKYKLDDYTLNKAINLRDNKEHNKKVLIQNAQMQQIKENSNRKMRDMIGENVKIAQEEQWRQMDANKRDYMIAEHHRKIAERDKEIFDKFSKPEQVTQAKLEMHRTQHIHQLSAAMSAKENDRINNWSKDKFDRTNAMMQDMLL